MKASELSRLDISKLQKDVFEVAKDHGWWEDCIVDGVLNLALAEQSIPEKNALQGTEVTEAFEDFLAGRMETEVRPKDGKPVGFPTELADIVIRTLDMAGATTIDVASAMRNIDVADSLVPFDDESERDTFIIFSLLRMHQCISHALEAFRRNEMSMVVAGNGGATGFPVDCAKLVRTCYVLATRLGIDLDAEIMLKHVFNKSREHRHGNKRC